MRTGAVIGVCLAVLLAGACRHDSSTRDADAKTTYDPKVVPLTPAPPLEPAKAEALRGRTIFLDPGHGGPWSGMVAPSNGLREADVNLRVALVLREQLEAHGANVIMSRDADTTLVVDSLSADLDARAAMSNAAQPDVFISIHHNAEVVAGSQKDDLEVYYKLGDNMASLDLGQSLIRGLSRGIRFYAAEKRLLPGNYKVLRLNDAPAVLLETAYLTNARDAGYLSRDDGIESEAGSILYGLAEYFAADPPKMMRAGESVEPLSTEFPPSFTERFSRGLPIDLDTIVIYRDDEAIDVSVESTDDGFRWLLAEPLANGTHTFAVTGRNMHGAGFRIVRPVAVNRPAARIEVTQYPAVASPGQHVLFEVRVADSLNMAVADGTPVLAGSLASVAGTVQGVARHYIASADLPETLQFTSGNIASSYMPVSGIQEFRTMSFLDSTSGAPVAEVLVTGNATPLGASNRDGWFAAPLDGLALPVHAYARGYETVSISVMGDGHAQVAMMAIADGVLLGRRIAIDPAHGGREPGVVSVDGARASDINRDVASRITEKLRRAGADVLMTRTGDEEVTDLQRIAVTEAFGPEIVVTVSFGSPPHEARPLDPVGHLRADLVSYVGHYPESVNGIRLASAVAAQFDGVPVTACVSYIVQQSGSPAIHVQPTSIHVLPPENAAIDAAQRRLVADRVYQGIVQYFADSDAAR